MNTLLLLIILGLNILISIWNCYVVGLVWKNLKFCGGFQKFLLYSGIIQSSVGFSIPLLLGTSYGITLYLTSGTEPSITIEQSNNFIQWILSFWYIAVIFPILGSGLAITIHSISDAYKTRDYESIVSATWNTGTQIHNTISAVNELENAVDNTSDLFGKLTSDDSDNNFALLAIIIVTFSILGGFIITLGLIKYFARNNYLYNLETY